MTYCFFDTSALVKRYYPESGTETVDELVEDPDRVVIITTLSVVETASAFRRKYNRDEIESDRMYGLLAAFFEEALADFMLIPLEDVSLESALGLVLADDLRTLDSIQLAAALEVRDELQGIEFITADRDLADVARAHHLETTVPGSDDDQ